MNRIKPIAVTVVYADKPDSPDHMEAAYNFLFNLVRLELLKQQGKTQQAEKPRQRYHRDTPSG